MSIIKSIESYRPLCDDSIINAAIEVAEYAEEKGLVDIYANLSVDGAALYGNPIKKSRYIVITISKGSDYHIFAFYYGHSIEYIEGIDGHIPISKDITSTLHAKEIINDIARHN